MNEDSSGRLQDDSGGRSIRPCDLFPNNFDNSESVGSDGPMAPVNEEVAEEAMRDEEEEVTEARIPRRAQTPFVPSARDREDHFMTGHATYRSWCPHCVQGRGRNLGHRSGQREEPPEFPVIFIMGLLLLGQQTVGLGDRGR